MPKEIVCRNEEGRIIRWTWLETMVNGYGRILETNWAPCGPKERKLGWVNPIVEARRRFFIRQHPKAKKYPKHLQY